MGRELRKEIDMDANEMDRATAETLAKAQMLDLAMAQVALHVADCLETCPLITVTADASYAMASLTTGLIGAMTASIQRERGEDAARVWVTALIMDLVITANGRGVKLAVAVHDGKTQAEAVRS
jgi:hypothetical protein